MTTPMTQGQRLAADAAAAAEIRSYQTDPDVVALRVEQIRSHVERLMWTGIVLGLAFTMVNVQHFAAAGAAAWSLSWCAAWLLDPMVSLVLLGVLRAEQVTAGWQVPMGPWPRVAKWSLLSATYVMNTWSSWAAGSPSGIVLHSVPVLTVFVAAEAVTDCQNKLTECVHRAHAYATDCAQRRPQDEQASHTTNASPTTGSQTALRLQPTDASLASSVALGFCAASRPPRSATARRRRPAAHRAARSKSGGRVLFADYLATARQALMPDVEVTPAWVRQVTGCSRGLSSRLATELRSARIPGSAAIPATAEQSIDQPATVNRLDQLEGKAA